MGGGGDVSADTKLVGKWVEADYDIDMFEITSEGILIHDGGSGFAIKVGGNQIKNAATGTLVYTYIWDGDYLVIDSDGTMLTLKKKGS